MPNYVQYALNQSEWRHYQSESTNIRREAA